jgi:hypothetical protein
LSSKFQPGVYVKNVTFMIFDSASTTRIIFDQDLLQKLIEKCRSVRHVELPVSQNLTEKDWRSLSAALKNSDWKLHSLSISPEIYTSSRQSNGPLYYFDTVSCISSSLQEWYW